MERTDLLVEITETGELRAKHSRSVNAPMEWRNALTIIDIVEEGSVVAEGDTLVRLDASFLDQEIEQVVSELETARVDLLRIHAEQKARWRTLDTARLQAEFSRESAQLQLEKLDYESETRRQEARLSFQRAEISLAEAEAKLKAQAILDSLEVARAELKIVNAENRLANERRQLDDMILVAPQNGMAIYGNTGWGDDARKLRLGDDAPPGGAVVEIPNLEQMEVVFGLHEIDREVVREGMPVAFTLWAYPDRVFTATISNIARMALAPKNESQVRHFQIVAGVDGSDEILKPGMSVQARIQVGRVDDALVIPVACVFEWEGRPCVFTRDAWPDPVAVELGPRNDVRVSVTSGLAEGDELSSTCPANVIAHEMGHARFVQDVLRRERQAKETQ